MYAIRRQKSSIYNVSSNQNGAIRTLLVLIIVSVFVFGFINTFRAVSTHAEAASPEIQSTIEGYCLDDLHDTLSANAIVDTWPCNGSPAQNFSFTGSFIKHTGFGCLTVKNSNTSAGSQVVLAACNGSQAQQWAIDLGGYQNSNSGLCLTVPNSRTEAQLTIDNCDDVSAPNQGWAAIRYSQPDNLNFNCNQGTEGQKVACNAEQQWSVWQSNQSNHTQLLTQYTDGNGYEEWCADFVSYIYKISGHPFTNGERDGWDEYDANSIQNMGFTLHDAASYTPKPGDVAYFDYSGGHVEIVVAGGKTPTFIYGDSGTTDPITNNGEMNEDMLISDGSAGQVQYYLSPN